MQERRTIFNPTEGSSHAHPSGSSFAAGGATGFAGSSSGMGYASSSGGSGFGSGIVKEG